MNCPRCGIENNAGSSFCKSCGLAISPAAQPVQPPYPAYYAPTQQPIRQTNNLALIGLILSFVIPLVGLIVSIVARKQCIERNEDGERLAKAGIIVGAVYGGLLALVFIVAFTIPFIMLSPMFDAPVFSEFAGMMV